MSVSASLSVSESLTESASAQGGLGYEARMNRCCLLVRDLQSVAVCCSVLQSVLQCLSVLQCVLRI